MAPTHRFQRVAMAGGFFSLLAIGLYAAGHLSLHIRRASTHPDGLFSAHATKDFSHVNTHSCLLSLRCSVMGIPSPVFISVIPAFTGLF
jgi:hypothetical protein